MIWYRRLQRCWFALLLCLMGILTLREAMRISKQSTESNWLAGPGGYITIIGGLLLCFAIFEFISGMRADHPVAEVTTKDKSFLNKKVWWSFLLVVLYLLLTPWLGFLISSGIFLVGSLRLLGCTVRSITIIILVTCLCMYFLFPILGISVPRGLLGI